jgi:predicted amidohydrolase
MQDLTVALVQANQLWEDKKGNFQNFEALFRTNLNQKVDLVVLPEMFNTSFTMNAKSMGESLAGESITWLKNMAKTFDTVFCASLIIEEENQFYNRLVLVDDSEIIAHYNKRHLFRMAGENEIFTPGKARIVVPFKGWNIMLQVCYDLRFPVFSRNKTLGEKKEYDALIYVANWPEKRNNAWRILLQARAIENQAFVIGVNRVGIDGNNHTYSGDSMVVDPWGACTLVSDEPKESVKIITLNSETLTNITRLFPAFKDADGQIDG